MGRRLTLSCRAMLDVPRRDLASVIRGLLTGQRRTYRAAYHAQALVDVPDTAEPPRLHLAVNVKGRPACWVDSDDVEVLHREIKELSLA